MVAAQSIDSHKKERAAKPKRKSRKVDVNQALSLKTNNKLSYKQIADIQGVWPNAIYKRIKHLLPDDTTKVYKDNRADILSALQVKLLSQVDGPRLKKLPIGTAVLAACQLYDKERLERGQSSNNIMVVHGDIAKLREEAINVDLDD